MTPADLSPEETAAIRALRRLAKKWPASLWLFSASGTLYVMRKGAGGEKVHTPGGGIDPAYEVATVHGIENDGGDW